MQYEESFEGHGVPFTLVRCPDGFSAEKICQEIVNYNLKANDIEKKFPFLKAVDFERSDKDFVFIVRSTRKFTDSELKYIKQMLVDERDDGIHFCLVVADYYDVERVPKMLVPFI